MNNDDKRKAEVDEQAEAEEVKAEAEGEVEEVVAEPVDDEPQAPAPARGGRGAIVGAWLIAVLGLAVGAGGIGAGYWVWQQQQATDARQSDTLADLNKSIVNLGANPDIQALRKELGEEVLAFRAANQAQNREIENLKDSLSAIHDVALRDQRGWVTAEIEYLIQIANHRLRLMRDFDGAIAALRAADQRVRDLGDPKLLPVREKLADEIQMLEDFERPDLVGIALRLDRLTNHLQPMPLQRPEQASTRQDLAVAVTEGEEKTVGGFFRHVWNEFQSNIDYREYGEPVRSLPDATSELHMNQLLRLRLEAARIAVLRQDDGEYHRQLKAAREWLTENFQGERATELAAELGALNTVNLRPELPMLTASLDKLKELERTRPQAPAAPASPAPAASPEAPQPATDSGADA